MSALVVIPARLAATRLPQKPLRLLAGKALIVRVLERVQSLSVGDAVVVATDSDEIAEVVRAAGGRAVMTRTDHASGTDRVAEVAARAEFSGYGVIVNVQGDEPFVSRDAVHRATELVASGKFPVATTACLDDPRVLDEPSAVKVVADESGRALYFSRAAIPYLRDRTSAEDHALRNARVLRHIGIYAYTRAALAQWVALPVSPLERIERLEQLRPLAAGIPIGVAVTADPGLAGIDTEDDLHRANAAWPPDLNTTQTPLATSPVPAGTR